MRIYLVGGAVRDEIMGLPSSDNDWVVVGSTPEQMRAAGFEQVGASFPVFIHPETGEEHALARTEIKAGSGYHGFDVKFDSDITIEQDLSRRDLTINSIAKDPETGSYIDPFHGIKDMQDCVLRHTSDAFADDPLRVIRLCRFAARFPHYSVSPETMSLAASIVKSGALNELPHERIGAEVAKMLATSPPNGAARFFTLLNTFEANQHITFFNGLNLSRLGGIAMRLAVFKFANPLQLLGGMCESSSPEVINSLGGSDATKLAKSLQHLKSGSMSQGDFFENLHDWMRAAGAFQGDKRAWHRAVDAINLSELIGEKLVVSHSEAVCAFVATENTASAVMATTESAKLGGAEIGKLIREERVKALRELYSNMFRGK